MTVGELIRELSSIDHNSRRAVVRIVGGPDAGAVKEVSSVKEGEMLEGTFRDVVIIVAK